MIEFRKIMVEEKEWIERLSVLASGIVKDHYDPIIGAEQNDYMIAMFQSPKALQGQIEAGHMIYIALEDGQEVGYFAYYKKEDKMYLDKFYLHKSVRGKGYGRVMLNYIQTLGREEGYPALFLNVNKYNQDSIEKYQHMGFSLLRSEKNPIGQGYYMDDYVFEIQL